MSSETSSAATELAEKTLNSQIEVDTVLCSSLEGFEVAEKLSEAFEAELDLRFTDSIEVPGNSEETVAGVADDGTVWVDREVKDEFKVSGAFIDRARIVKARLLGLEKIEYCEDNTLLSGKKVLIADRNINDSNRIAAGIGSITKQGAVDIYVAAPSITEQSAKHLEELTDQLFYLDNDVEAERNGKGSDIRPERLEEYEF